MTTERPHTTDAILRSAIATVRDVLMPELTSAWARTSALQLIGMLAYARARTAADPERSADLAEALAVLLLDEPALAAQFGDFDAALAARGGDASALHALAGELLVHAQRQDGPGSVAIRERLRPLLLRRLGEDLAGAQVMMQTFRGVLPDALA
jgi:hypothetical protein